MKVLLLTIGVSAAIVGPTLAHDYNIISTQDKLVEYIDPTTIKSEGNIKTFWQYTAYYKTTGKTDYLIGHESIDCKNDKFMIIDTIAYRLNGVPSSDNKQSNPDPSHIWFDIVPETTGADEEDAVCRGNTLGQTTADSFADVVIELRAANRSQR